MSKQSQNIVIGNVIRADIRGFVVASRIPEPDVPTFGTFVQARIQQGRADLVGLVYDISLQDDPFLKNLALNVVEGNPQYEEIIRDQQENRAVPVEISVAAIAYRLEETERYLYGFPPQPPMILHQISVCTQDQIRLITAKPDFMRALLDNRDIPVDELIATVLTRTALMRPENVRHDFLLDAGRYLAGYMGRDPLRLEKILRWIEAAHQS